MAAAAGRRALDWGAHVRCSRLVLSRRSRRHPSHTATERRGYNNPRRGALRRLATTGFCDLHVTGISAIAGTDDNVTI